MKHLAGILLLTISIFCCHDSVAQNRLRPWSVGIGFNAVDFYPNGEGSQLSGTDPKPFSRRIFSEYFNGTDHYNGSLMSVQVSFGRYLFNNISLEASVSYNEISEYGDLEVDNLDYLGIDGSLNYSFRNIIEPRGDGWADPFIGIGGGFTWVEEERTRDMLGTGNFNASIGFAVWISNNVSIIYSSTFKYIPYEHEHRDYTDSHFKHLIGMKYVFAFRCSTCYNFK